MKTQRDQPVAVRHFFCLLFLLMLASSNAYAQQDKKQPAESLTEGLLDLLEERTTAPQKSNSGTKSSSAPEISPEDVGLSEADLTEQQSDPLESVRQSMLIAAGFLQRGSAGSSTQTLQEDIVTRLDELIAELQRQKSQAQQDAQEQARQQKTSSQSQSESQPNQQQQQQQAQSSKEQSENKADAQDPSNPSSPGNRGKTADATVKLNDPKVLQQNAWGQLPERVRSQMQSRMVERFLPAYQAQIEAYYRALLKK